jgi:ribosome-binding ATPase YchF (GTP1/OBG family)
LFKYIRNYVIEEPKKENSLVIPITAQIEADLAGLEKEEKQEFLNELGLNESGLDTLTKAMYSLLGLETYFTAGEDELRAWTFKKGMTAPECAGIIHTDFQRGFIKAEVYTYENIMEYKSELKVKENGKLRMEGKEYIVKDGDIMFFKFNV